ncbi:MAG: YdcF family protein [Planctomycetota bacterium]|nr:YdcF family protein [Planctomycetota bacterium]
MIVSNPRIFMRRVLDAGVHALALFALANLVLAAFSDRWDPTWLWVQGGALPSGLVHVLAALFAVGVLCLHRRHPALALVVRAAALLLSVACLADAIAYYRLLAAGHISSAVPVPLSLGLAIMLLAWAVVARPESPYGTARTRRALWLRVLDRTAPLWLGALGLLLHVMTIGVTDYARPADAAVVFGAAVRASGQPSQALRDRTVAACELYHRGLVDRIVLSGGRDPRAPLSEPECMAVICQTQGVPAEALVFDEAGVNTQASVESTRVLARRHGWRRVLMVSHDYHLARIQMVCRKAGVRAYTVPAAESRPMLLKPWFTLRELAAYGAYFARP